MDMTTLPRRFRRPSVIIKRSIAVAGHKTSVSIETAFWRELRAMARSREVPLACLVTDIDAARASHEALSSALRIAAMAWLRQQANPASVQHLGGT